MKFYILILLWGLLLLSFQGLAQEERVLRGKITDEQGAPLPGATLYLKESGHGAVTDPEGLFSLEVPQGAAGDTLRISYIGYVTEVMPLPAGDFLEVQLLPDIATLLEVEVVSTGYQQLPRERATGSFTQLGEEALDRTVSPDILGQLQGMAPGLLLTPGGSLSIRGQSTLFANEAPLVVLDNFPYEGDLRNINPNDVESITLLKDAAAASIWGARAGNGVIVIQTKKGRLEQAPRLSLNSSVRLGAAPDPFYVPRMSTADFIATEQRLFAQGYYNFYENAYDQRAISPLVELLIAERDGLLSSEALSAEIARLREQEVRHDFARYLYRPSLWQQYAASLSGGGQRQRYYFSAGYDRAQETLVGNANDRLTLNARNSWTFAEERFRLSGDLYYVRGLEENNGLEGTSLRQSLYDPLPPYSRLADEEGNPLAVIRDYRLAFIEEAEEAGLLDWRYRPLEERALQEKTNRLSDFRARLEAGVRLLPSLEGSLSYQYWNSQQLRQDHFPAATYFARDLINRYTQQAADGSLLRPIPVGGVLDEYRRASASHQLRAQLSYSQSWQERHALDLLAGWEVKEVATEGSRFRYYGYEEDKALLLPVDGAALYPQYHFPGWQEAIPMEQDRELLQDRFLSYYANASYVLKERYILSLSGRKDQSNLFGVEANQKGVPLWSAGLGWNLHQEEFFRWKALPYLKVRATYGYNGNIDKSVSAFTTARLLGHSFTTQLPYAGISNPPNPALQWERVEIFNLGLDFASRNNRLSGSLEWYRKNGRELMGFVPVSPVKGIQEFRGNVAATEGKGLDLQLSSLNLQGDFRWQTDFLYSYASTLVSDYQAEVSPVHLLQNGVFPREGFPIRSLYSYDWAGLNPENGNPQGYLEGALSEDYGAIINGMVPDSLLFHGSVMPTHFGALRNTFRWKGLSLSFRLLYRLGYYFRRESIRYGYNQGLGGHGDYAFRWQQPGDEAFTEVPSIPLQGNAYRDDFYLYSEALVERGDHVRLQDVRLSYTFDRPGRAFSGLELYAYGEQLGLLWKATTAVPDPDYRYRPAPRSISLGLKATF